MTPLKSKINPMERITKHTPNAQKLLELEEKLMDILDEIIDEREEALGNDFNVAVGQTLIMLLDSYDPDLSLDVCRIFIEREKILNKNIS